MNKAPLSRHSYSILVLPKYLQFFCQHYLSILQFLKFQFVNLQYSAMIFFSLYLAMPLQSISYFLI
jgi:hypothetical protein